MSGTRRHFSTTLVQETEPFDFLNLYIPTNPFNSLANNIVPAVVLFSLILGAALMTIPEKARLLAPKDPAPHVGLVRVALASSDVPTDYAAAPKNPGMLALLRKLDAALRSVQGWVAGQVPPGRSAPP